MRYHIVCFVSPPSPPPHYYLTMPDSVHALSPDRDVVIVNELHKVSACMVLCKPTVFEILLAFSQHKDWKRSFYEVIPPRKVDKGDKASGPHQFMADTNDFEDQPISPQFETACDDITATVSAITRDPLMDSQRENKESEIIASTRNKEDFIDSDNGASDGSSTL